jgi:chaperonin GroES
MSYQLLEEMDGWEEDTDRLLIMLPIVGCVFRKTYFDPVKGYNCSHVVGPDKFVVNYWTKDLEVLPAGHARPGVLPARGRREDARRASG